MTTPMLKNYRVIKSNQVCSEKYFLETLINQGFQGNMPLSIAGTYTPFFQLDSVAVEIPVSFDT